MENVLGLLVVGFFFRILISYLYGEWFGEKHTECKNKKKNNILVNQTKIGSGSQDYFLRKSIMTPTELQFFKLLQKQIDGRYLIFSKIRLIDIFGVKDCLYDWEYKKCRNKILAKHIDFIIADNEGRVILLIELDDIYHENKIAKINDEFKNQVTSEVGVTLLRFFAGDTNLKEIEQYI